MRSFIKRPAPRKTFKLSFIVGHTSRSRGAYSPFMQMYEWDYNMDLAERITQASKGTRVDVKIFIRDPDMRWDRALKKAYNASDTWGANASTEGHFNSFKLASAQGTLTLRYDSMEAAHFASFMHQAMLDSFGLPDDGIRTLRNKYDRGFSSVIAGKAPGLVLEPGFGSNAEDSAALLEHRDLFAETFIDYAQRYAHSIQMIG